MKKPIFECRNLMFTKNSTNILNIKKFEIHRSACYLFNGNMASGKTLLLDILSKNNANYSGDIKYEDVNFKNINKKNFNRDVRYVKQTIRAPYFKTVKSYIESIIGKDGNAKKNINEIVKVMDFKYILNTKMRDLSPGQLRWIDLAANIAAFPKVLFIDEIELHLSMSKIKNLSKVLYRKVNYEGITIIATTQNRDFFSNLSSVTININHGRITSVRSKSFKK